MANDNQPAKKENPGDSNLEPISKPRFWTEILGIHIAVTSLG